MPTLVTARTGGRALVSRRAHPTQVEVGEEDRARSRHRQCDPDGSPIFSQKPVEDREKREYGEEEGRAVEKYAGHGSVADGGGDDDQILAFDVPQSRS